MKPPCNQVTCLRYFLDSYVPPQHSSKPNCAFIIGESPGHDEFLQGTPFVGHSGQLLNKVLSMHLLSRDDFYVTNAVKCFSRSNDLDDCGVFCKSLLLEELKKLRPKKILVLGSKAQEMLDGRKISKIRGFPRILKLSESTLLPDYSDRNSVDMIGTYHPASIFRTPENFDLFFHDVGKFARLNSFQDLQTFPQTIILNAKPSEIHNLGVGGEVAIDLETSSFELGSKILCVVLANDKFSMVIKWGDEVKKMLQDMSASGKWKFIGQNIAFDIGHLRHYGIDLKEVYFDTMIAHHLLVTYLPHDLDTLATLYTDMPDWSYLVRDVVGHGKDAHFDKIPVERLYAYAAKDGIATWLVKQALKKELRDENLLTIFEHAMCTMRTVCDMKTSGVKIDLERFETARSMLDVEIGKYKEQVYSLAKEEFNLDSPIQLSKILFQKLKLKSSKQTKTGLDSTDREVLERLEGKHAIIPPLMDYKKLSKLRSTFVSDKLYEMIDTRGRLHTTYKVTGTTSGRLASEKPSLQNIPRKGYIRQFFTVEPGYKFLEADFSLAELRVIAYLSGDRVLISMLEKGTDFHREMASKIFKISPELITREQRVLAKYVDFGVTYGRGWESVATQFRLPEKEARAIVQDMYDTFPQLTRWIEDTINEAKRTRKLTTVFGRVRRFPIYGKFISDWEREARSFHPQSIVADLTLRAMYKLNDYLKDTKSRLIMNLHDSLMFEILDEELATHLPVIKRIMEEPIPLLDKSIPVEISISDRWWGKEYWIYDGKTFQKRIREDE